MNKHLEIYCFCLSLALTPRIQSWHLWSQWVALLQKIKWENSFWKRYHKCMHQFGSKTKPNNLHMEPLSARERLWVPSGFCGGHPHLTLLMYGVFPWDLGWEWMQFLWIKVLCMCASTTAVCLVISTKRQSHPLLSLLCITQTQKVPPPFCFTIFPDYFSGCLWQQVTPASLWNQSMAPGRRLFLVQNVNSFE